MTYSDKLKSPKWQKKRLKIMERDKFKCLECGDTERTLHVHHISYIIGRDPWDYPNNNFKTLCETCHENQHNKHEVEIPEARKPVIYVSIRETVSDLTKWFNNSYGSISISEQYDFIRYYHSSPIITILALSEISSKIAKELNNKLDQDKEYEVTRMVMNIRQLRLLLAKEARINPVLPI